MPIRGKRQFICSRCGKTFTIEIGDNITGKDLDKLKQCYCTRCRIVTKIFSR